MIAKNNKTIEDAFKRLAATEHFGVLSGMKALLDAAVVFALKVHEERYLHNHLETGDTYGWALGYQGQCAAIKLTTWEDLPDPEVMSIRETLTNMVIKLSSKKTKYVGVVMAGMSPASYFNVDIEDEVLETTKHMVESDFERYFTAI